MSSAIENFSIFKLKIFIVPQCVKYPYRVKQKFFLNWSGKNQGISFCLNSYPDKSNLIFKKGRYNRGKKTVAIHAFQKSLKKLQKSANKTSFSLNILGFKQK